MKAVYISMLGVATLLGGCGGEDGVFDSLKPRATVFYYNQITSNGAADQSDLTADVSLEGDDSDSASDVGYSRGDEGPELRVRIDEANDNEDNSAALEGTSTNGATLFRERIRPSNDAYYTAISYGDTTRGNTDVAVFPQDQSDVPSGSVRFRVINTVDPDTIGAFSFDLRYNDAGAGNYFASGLGFGKATEYQTINSGRLYLVVASNGFEPEEKLTTADCTVSGARSYDVILAVSDPLNPPMSDSEVDGELVLYCHPQERN